MAIPQHDHEMTPPPDADGLGSLAQHRRKEREVRALQDTLRTLKQLRAQADAEPALSGKLKARLDRLQARLQATLGHTIAWQPDDVSEATRAYRDEGVVVAFWEAVLLLPRYERTVSAEGRVIDTARSQTFAGFRPDAAAGGLPGSLLRESLAHCFPLDAQQLAGIEQRLQSRDAALELRRAIICAIEDECRLFEPGVDLDVQVLQLFGFLVPGVPVRAGELRIVKTETSLLFFIDDAAWREGAPADARAPAEQAQCRAFLKRLAHFEFAYFAHFPTFGFFEGAGVTPGFIDRIAVRAELAPELVRETLTTMVSILPARDVDKYVIHDTWGHQWQSYFTPFAEDYRVLGQLASPLTLDERCRVRTGDESGELRLADLFRVEFGVRTRAGGPRITVDVPLEAARAFFHAEATERVYVALTATVAEVLADAVEYKFILLNPSRQECLASSSLYKTSPTKLDLTLIDLELIVAKVLTPLLEIATPAEGDAVREGGGVLEQQLVAYTVAQAEEAIGAPLPEAAVARVTGEVRRALRRLQRCFRAEYDRYFEPRFEYRRGTETIQVNVFTKVMQNLLSLQFALDQIYDHVADPALEATLQRLPIRGHRDLLLLFISLYYGADKERNFWRVDEVIAYCFVPMWRQWLEALAGACP